MILHTNKRFHLLVLIVLFSVVGCRSPYYADRGAALGGVTGAGVGAAVGNAQGATGAGAAIGGVVGALTGALVGNTIDDIEARNQAFAQQQVARRATVQDIVAMSDSGIGDEVISEYVRTNGMARYLVAADLIALKQQGVSDSVIQVVQSMNTKLPVVSQASAVAPVVVEEYHYSSPPPLPPYCWHPRGCRPTPSRHPWMDFGFSYHR